MVLEKLHIENFQGIKDFSIEPEGKNISVYGDNATGKTTIFNAITWLLFGKVSSGIKGFTPKPRDSKGEIHHLESAVESVFTLDDGKKITLKKIFKEVWTKKRGAIAETFTGHEIQYFINGVPNKEKDYNALILDLFGKNAEIPKILMVPDYFAEQMKWEDRRKILLEICGDIDFNSVIKEDEELKDLPKLMKQGDSDELYSPDDFRKIIMSRRRDLNKILDGIPARIDEATKAKPDLTGLDRDALKKEESEQRAKVDELSKRISKINADKGQSEVDRQITELNKEYAEKSQKFTEEQHEKDKTLYEAYQKDADELLRIRNSLHQITWERDGLKEDIERKKNLREELVKEWNEVADSKWTKEAEICPTCGQKLPADEISNKRIMFNKTKSERLESLNNRGQSCSKEVIEKLEKEFDEAQNTITKLTEKEKELSEKQDKFNNRPFTAFDDTDEAKELKKKIADLKEHAGDESSATEVEKDLRTQRFEMVDKLDDIVSELLKFDIAETQDKRISELEEQQRSVSAQFDETEKSLYLIDLFVKTKVRLLTDRINEKFEKVSFQLFEEQINGGVKECCEVLVPTADGKMIPYAYSNNAGRINAGLEIIRTLSSYWNIRMPIVIDNAEAVTHLETTDAQIIRLVVSENDKKLRIVRD